jgi:hypothetical protein
LAYVKVLSRHLSDVEMRDRDKTLFSSWGKRGYNPVFPWGKNPEFGEGMN